jgi:hypothetical protein
MSTLARRMWTVAEPFHALTYFATESHQAFEAAGLRGFWRGYFAGRAAPLGATSANLVTAIFFGFHPAFVARAVPSIWSLLDPAGAIEARLAGIDHAVHRIFGADAPTADMARAATALRRAAEGASVAGHPLFGANLDLAWPDPAHLALWHAVTLLREHRGDGHVSALVAAGVDPCEAHVLRVATDDLPLDSIQPYRGWSEEDWSGATDRLRGRGIVGADDRATPTGHRTRAAIEDTTDRLSAVLVDHVDDPETVVDVLAVVTRRLAECAVIPYPNPIGVPPPATPG